MKRTVVTIVASLTLIIGFAYEGAYHVRAQSASPTPTASVVATSSPTPAPSATSTAGSTPTPPPPTIANPVLAIDRAVTATPAVTVQAPSTGTGTHHDDLKTRKFWLIAAAAVLSVGGVAISIGVRRVS